MFFNLFLNNMIHIYHLLVVLAAADISLDELWDELARRRQQSGIDEKASRDE